MQRDDVLKREHDCLLGGRASDTSLTFDPGIAGPTQHDRPGLL